MSTPTITGRFEKVVDSFPEGICDLTDISFSALQSLQRGLEDAEIPFLKYHVSDDECEYYIPRFETLTSAMMVAACAANSMGGEDGQPCGITEFTWGGCEYETSRGVVFGWKRVEEYPIGRYLFWVIHPDAGMMMEDSTLRESALERGWSEVFLEG